MCYLLFVGIAYAAVFLVGCVVAAAIKPRSVRCYSLRLRNLAIFLIILLLVGDAYGCIWGDLIWGRFYRSTDYCGTDFLPFLPVTRVVIDAAMGSEPHGLMGITLFELNLIWSLFALTTWATTIASYRFVLRCFDQKLIPRQESPVIA